MFSSGFAETSELTPNAGGDTQSDVDDAASETPSFSSSKWTRYFEDSDDEEDGMLVDDVDEATSESMPSSQLTSNLALSDSLASLSPTTKDSVDDSATAGSDNETDGRNVRPKLTHHSSPGGGAERLEPEWQLGSKAEPVSGPTRLHVVVKDVAYTTYRAVLYYVSVSAYWALINEMPTTKYQIYTDTIVFAPLSSSFNSTSQATMSSTLSLPLQLLSEGQNITGAMKAGPQSNVPANQGPDSRRAWIAEWQNNNPGRPTPCSAKAVYRLADSALC